MFCICYISDLNEPSTKPRPILKVPPHTMTPYNAQATMHFPSGFWSLYLPITVAGRVSDIWRSYFAQALFKRIGVSLGFLPRPIVVQDRNPHSNEADFNAEIPLYTKSSALVSHLVRNYVMEETYKSYSFIETLESLWVDMYERNYIEEQDVIIMQEWISALLKVGYQFPPIKQSFISYKKEVIGYDIDTIAQERKKLNNFGRKINRRKATPSDVKSNCDSEKYSSIIFGSSDVHDGPRTDISSILLNMNQTYVHVGPREISKNYPRVLELPGLKFARENPSFPLKVYNDHSTYMDPSWPKINSMWYAHTSVGHIDAFICSFPASMCQLWIPMNKSIIFMPAHRYNLGRCSVNDWRQLDNDIIHLNNLQADFGHTIAAVSRYDVEYIRYYTGIKASLVSSYSGFYMDSSLYKGDKPEILIFCYASRGFVENVAEALLPEFAARQVYDMYRHYSENDLGRHRTVVTLPYSVMSYRTTELYALGMPLFAPSITFYMNYYDPKRGKKGVSAETKSQKAAVFGFGWDRTSTSFPYCNKDPNLEKNMRPLLNATKSIHPYSPNVDIMDDVEAENYWLQFSDFYDWPHIQYFDNYKHLKQLLLHTNFTLIHELMKQEVAIRKKMVKEQWCDIINRVGDSRKHS